jgi:GST-like protein
MIDLYTWLTPNGRKVSLMLEECGLPYRVIPVDIGAGDQNKPEFRGVNPNGKIPAIVDHDGPMGTSVKVFESGSILLYLAHKTRSLLPTEPHGQWSAMSWLFFQTSSFGPALGQAQHFLHYAPASDAYAAERFRREATRLYSVLDVRLAGCSYLAGDEYTIADIATWPWVKAWKIQGVVLDDYPNVRRWFAAIAARPAVSRESLVLADRRRTAPLSDSQRAVLFRDTTHSSGGAT